MTEPAFTKNFSYVSTSSGNTTNTISGINIIANGITTNLLYNYDANGNLQRLRNRNLIVRYEYDPIGQLIRYDDADSGHTFAFTTMDSKITSQKNGNFYMYFHYDSVEKLSGIPL